ncbi:hypothetical protein M0804_007778 [Polistes exclamans]|nr:hypothetical protein M0804_007778 [Polistes exclamans]
MVGRSCARGTAKEYGENVGGNVVSEKGPVAHGLCLSSIYLYAWCRRALAVTGSAYLPTLNLCQPTITGYPFFPQTYACQQPCLPACLLAILFTYSLTHMFARRTSMPNSRGLDGKKERKKLSPAMAGLLAGEVDSENTSVGAINLAAFSASFSDWHVFEKLSWAVKGSELPPENGAPAAKRPPTEGWQTSTSSPQNSFIREWRGGTSDVEKTAPFRMHNTF